jgi:type IV pilus assembly protein PilA
MRREQRGFSLVELLVVIAIILIIAAITVPNLMRAKLAANEASGVGSIRTISTASITYSSTYGNGFPPNLGAAGGPAGATTSSCDQALLIDSVLSGGGGSSVSAQKSGYNFNYIPVAAISPKPAGCSAAGSNSFVLNAVPVTPGSTGIRTFCTDSSGVIRFDDTGAAAPTTQAACDALTNLR